MTALSLFRTVLILCLVVWALWSDMREGRIPNALSYSGIALGLALASLQAGIEGLFVSALGVLFGAGPFLVLFLMGQAVRKPWVGGGDVKLMAAIGAYAGPFGALWTVYYALGFGFVYAASAYCWCKAARRAVPGTLPFASCLALGMAAALLRHFERFATG